ncbi:MAG: prepilin-type N-terminal cleavage/methylation domain-containing protein [Phycisphaerales bacterium]
MRTCPAEMRIDTKCRRGFTLVEAMIALVIASLMVGMAMLNLQGTFIRSTFRGQVHDFVSTLQLAARSAAETGRRYEVIIDLVEQVYVLREITSPDLAEILEEEIIVENEFGDNCQVVYVLFDDLVETNEDHQIAKFRAGRTGWQNGGKIVLLDRDDNPYTVVVDRMSRLVRLEIGEVDILMPKRKDEVPF